MSDYLNLQNPYDHTFWNRDDYTARHRAVFNVAYALPVGRGRRFLSNSPGIVDTVLGGWTLYTVTYLQSGQYFSPSFSGSDPSNTNTSGGLPDRIADGNIPRGQRGVDRWFDASAFTVPPLERFGNSGVNILEGPGLNHHNVSINKRFKLAERVSFEFIGSISNLFNHPEFTFPHNNISVPGAVARLYANLGEYSAERGASRAVELKGRVRW